MYTCQKRKALSLFSEDRLVFKKNTYMYECINTYMYECINTYMYECISKEEGFKSLLRK